MYHDAQGDPFQTGNFGTQSPLQRPFSHESLVTPSEKTITPKQDVKEKPAPPAESVPNKPPSTVEVAAGSPDVQHPDVKPQPELSQQAVDKRLRRVLAPRANGTYMVSEDFRRQFESKGEDRDRIRLLFEKCDYNPERGFWVLTWTVFLFFSSKIWKYTHPNSNEKPGYKFLVWLTSERLCLRFKASCTTIPAGQVRHSVQENH